MSDARSHKRSRLGIFVVVAAFLLSACAKGPYMKMDPPPDVDKAQPIVNDDSCWMATASNMLAAVGYGDGTTVQARGDDIYADMVAQYTVVNGGWTDAALQWWLGSNNNTWNHNPYTVVTVHGNKSPAYPWADPVGAELIANELRRCLAVGVSTSVPTSGASVGVLGHANTAWGDPSADTASITGNPSGLSMTDSDTDAGGDVQQYTYDDYTNPNPGGPSEGNGWYIDYGADHRYIKHIVTLEPTDDPSDDKLTQKVIGSFEIIQNEETSATDLHYDVGTDVRLLSYRTFVDWPADDSPTITESGSPRDEITVDWEFTDEPVPFGETVRITTEFVLPTWNAMTYENVQFTYPHEGDAGAIPDLAWILETPFLDEPERIVDVTGGYVVGAFEILDGRTGELAAEYRLVHQYAYSQDPEFHLFTLRGDPGTQVANVRFGHSYGLPSDEELWSFELWLSQDREVLSLEEPVVLRIDWEGLLPYPEGDA